MAQDTQRRGAPLVSCLGIHWPSTKNHGTLKACSPLLKSVPYTLGVTNTFREGEEAQILGVFTLKVENMGQLAHITCMLTPKQSKAPRALLGWTQTDPGVRVKEPEVD